MFARAAIIGRVTRERAEARRSHLATKEELKKRTPVAPLRQRCFLPMMQGPCVVLVLAFILIIGGAIMCHFAFHAEQFALDSPTSNQTGTVNASKLKALKSLTYVGPSLMGSGVFIIIIACVILLEKRDLIIKSYIDGMIEAQQEISMELSYRVAPRLESVSTKTETNERTTMVPVCRSAASTEDKSVVSELTSLLRQSADSYYQGNGPCLPPHTDQSTATQLSV